MTASSPFAYDPRNPYTGIGGPAGYGRGQLDAYPAGSLETVGVEVTGDHDLSGVVIEASILPSTRTATNTDRWTVPDEVSPTSEPDQINVRLLIGPGSTWGALTPGVYRVWVAVTEPGGQRALVGSDVAFVVR